MLISPIIFLDVMNHKKDTREALILSCIISSSDFSLPHVYVFLIPKLGKLCLISLSYSRTVNKYISLMGTE